MSIGASKRIVLILAATSRYLSAFTTSAVAIALPAIGTTFSMNAVLLGWVNTSYHLVSAAFFIPIGKFADIYGRRKVFFCGILIHTVASFICAVSNSTVLFLIFRTLGGIGAAMMAATAVAILTSVSPPQERGRSLGVVMAAIALGVSTGPFIGGLLTQQIGWQSIFYFCTLLGLVVAVLAVWKLKGEWADARGERFDVFGTITLGLSVLLIMYGFSTLPTLSGTGFIVLGILCLLVFVRRETRTENPVFDIGLFRKNKAFVFSSLATLINYSATFGVTFLLSLYLQYNRGFSPQTAGFILLAQPVMQAIMSPIAGRLSDRIEPRIVAATGMAFSCVSLSSFTFLTEETALGLVVGTLVVNGFGAALFAASNVNAVMGSVEKKFFGVASGAQAMMITCGMTLSMGIVMILFSLFIGQAQITPEYYLPFLRSMKVSFIIFTALIFSGIFTQLAGRKVAGAVSTNSE